MADVRRRIAKALGIDTPAGPVLPDVAAGDTWFDAGECRNCGAALTTSYCGGCGQKAARRFVWRDIRTETWDRLRLFELPFARTLARLLVAPGTVAREYVMGRRAAHMHPLKLLVAVVAILILLLTANRYFGLYADVGKDAVVTRMAQRVLAYANWSFSLGIVAIYAAAWFVFRRRLGYNAIEIAVMAIYCQSIILALVIVNLLPTLVWRSPDFILAHKAASQYYVPAAKMLIVAVAYTQFFLLKLRDDWPKLLLSCILSAAINWALLRIYAMSILWVVSR